MPSLLIPKTGLSLDASSSAKGGLDAFNVTLPDNVIEDMIKCVRNGKDIQLSLGPNPVLTYGNNEQHFQYNEDTFTTELYRSELDPSNTSSKMPVFNSRHSIFQMKRMVPTTRPTSSNSAPATISTPSAMAGADSALTTLQNSLAKENEKKSNNTIKYIKDGSGLPPPVQQRGPAKAISNTSRFLSAKNKSLGNDTTRSMPTSPALSGVGSPSLNPTSNPTSASKTIRSSLIHELAVGSATKKELADRMGNSPSEIASTLDKVADVDGDKFKLRHKCFKELDVFKYPYESHALRQTAIDNAVRAFDKLRMGTGEPEWEKLLPVKDRGLGKCLSKLQTKIAETAVQRALPKPAKVLKASKSPNPQSKEVDSNEDVSREKLSPKKTDTRSTSQPPITNKKRVSEKEAQAKRLLGKPSKAQASKQKPSANQEKFKSSEFVNDSDEEDDYLQPPTLASAPVKKAVSTPQPTSISISQSKSTKRARDDDVEKPVAKKVKKTSDEADKATKHRMSDASRSSQSTHASTSSISTSASASSKKTTSPQKSSPLASSPANASDIDAPYTTSTSSDRSPDGTKTQHHQKVLHGRVTKKDVGTRDRGLQWKRDWKDYIRLREELVAHKIKNKEWERKCHRLRDMYARLLREKEGFWRDYRARS